MALAGTTAAAATSPGSSAATSTAATTTSNAAAEAETQTSNGIEGLPQWLQPGVSPGIHIGLRIVLFLLNCLLGCCALMQLLSPHFEVMFLLSLGLTGCYFCFMWELAKISAQGAAETATAATEADGPTATEKEKEEMGEGKKDL